MALNLISIGWIAHDLMADKRSHNWKEKGNKYHHGQRVANLAITLRERLVPDDGSYDDILRVAAWFHDLRNGEENHEALAAEQTWSLLDGLCTDEERIEICGLIRLHDARGRNRESAPVWLKILQDADHLDHFGSLEVWVCVLHSMEFGRSPEELASFLLNERPAEDERYFRECNFELSREILREKNEYMYSFARRLRIEADGRLIQTEEPADEPDEHYHPTMD